MINSRHPHILISDGSVSCYADAIQGATPDVRTCIRQQARWQSDPASW